jgi:hypothetical protein
MVELLFKQPHKGAYILEIDAALAGDRPLRTISEAEALALSDDEGRNSGFTRAGGSDPIPATPERIADVKAAIEKLEKDSVQADLGGDMRKAKELDAQVAKLRGWLKEQERLAYLETTGRKEADSPQEKARQRLKNNFKNALEMLKDEGLPLFAAHLQDCIGYAGYHFIYKPPERVSWVFEEKTR